MEAGILATLSILVLSASMENPEVLLLLTALEPGSQMYLVHLSNPRKFEFTIPEYFLAPMLGMGYFVKFEQRALLVNWYPVTIHLIVGILSGKQQQLLYYSRVMTIPGNSAS